MDSLGSRIRTLRKERKMTLEALAGEKITKGMLSLIENDKAKPSMESLTYIAERLNVKVNELLESVSTSELREILKNVEEAFKAKQYDIVIDSMRGILDKDLPIAYESAKIMECYGKSCYFLNKKEWKDVLLKADEIFMTLNFYNQSAKLGQFFVKSKMDQHLYEDAIKLLRQKKDFLQERQVELDILNQLDFIWLEVGLLFSVNKYDEASELLKEAITLSKEKNVYYRIEEFYRIAHFYAMINHREKDMKFYLDKLALFAEFIDSENSKINVMSLQIHYYNSYAKQYDKALEVVEKLYSSISEDLKRQLKYFYVMEKGKALYGKQEYKQALDYLLQFEEVKQWNHPFDLSIMYEVYAYIGRCYFILGDKEKAYKNVKYAMDHVKELPKTLSKDFIIETIKFIKG